MSEQTDDEMWDDIYYKANSVAQDQCTNCSPRQHYVCSYHDGWADGFESAIELVKMAQQHKSTKESNDQTD